MSEWQPIETAPKDGTVVDLWMIDESGKQWREADAYYVTSAVESYTEFRQDGSYKHLTRARGGWWAPNHDYEGMNGWCDVPRHFNSHPNQMREIYTEATHWMPLPPPPSL